MNKKKVIGYLLVVILFVVTAIIVDIAILCSLGE